jgi:hypothetical protein
MTRSWIVLDKEKMLKMLKLDIQFAKEQIIKAQDNGDNNLASYFNGMLEAYENIENRIKNGIW